MQCLKFAPRSLAALFILMLAGIPSTVFLRSAVAQPGDNPFDPSASSHASPSSSEPFTGSLTLRQKAGTLYYKIFVVRGKVIGGYDTWHGSSTHYHDIVGGWYDGKRMVLLIQSTQDDLGDKWYSQSHHFEKDGDQFIIKHTLYGFGKTESAGEVYKPHVVEEIRELPAEKVQRLAASAESANEAEKASDSAKPALERRVNQLERENRRLKELAGGLLMEKSDLAEKLRKSRTK